MQGVVQAVYHYPIILTILTPSFLETMTLVWDSISDETKKNIDLTADPNNVGLPQKQRTHKWIHV